jgi:hypothetical protein
MSHVIDRNAVKQVDLGPCDLPNCQYPVHWVKLGLRYSYMDKMGLADAFNNGVEQMARYRFLKRVKDWNLVDEKGRKLPITQNSLGELTEDIATQIWKAIDELDNEDAEPDLPNA